MKQFWRSCASCIAWLAVSELLCLVLAFSFAILRPAWIRYLSLLCCAAAHLLLMWQCGEKTALRDAAGFRLTGRRVPRKKALLTAAVAALTMEIPFLFLCMVPGSSAVLNVFLLLNAPYIQFYRIILDGLEPFSALPLHSQIWLALPPSLSACVLYIGTEWNYEKKIVAIRQQRA